MHRRGVFMSAVCLPGSTLVPATISLSLPLQYMVCSPCTGSQLCSMTDSCWQACLVMFMLTVLLQDDLVCGGTVYGSVQRRANHFGKRSFWLLVDLVHLQLWQPYGLFVKRSPKQYAPTGSVAAPRPKAHWSTHANSTVSNY